MSGVSMAREGSSRTLETYDRDNRCSTKNTTQARSPETWPRRRQAKPASLQHLNSAAEEGRTCCHQP